MFYPFGSSLLFTEVAHHPPVGLWYCKPFTVSWSDVDVHGAKVVVLLVTWRVTQMPFRAQILTQQSRHVSTGNVGNECENVIHAKVISNNCLPSVVFFRAVCSICFLFLSQLKGN